MDSESFKISDDDDIKISNYNSSRQNYSDNASDAEGYFAGTFRKIGASMIDNNGENLMVTEAEHQREDRKLTWLEGFFRALQIFLAEFAANLFFFSVTFVSAANGSSSLVQAWVETSALMFVLAVFMRENAGHLDVFLTPVLWFLGKLGLPAWYMPVYWLAQIVAVILATLFTWSLTEGFDRSFGLGVTRLAPGYTQGQGAGAEVLGTFIETSVFIWLLMSFGVRNYYEQIGTSYKSVVLFILSVGFSHLTVALTFGPITGASFNWLRHFSPAVISGTIDSSWWIYFVGSLFGTLLALVVFKIYIWIDSNAGEHAYKKQIKKTKLKNC